MVQRFVPAISTDSVSDGWSAPNVPILTPPTTPAQNPPKHVVYIDLPNRILENSKVLSPKADISLADSHRNGIWTIRVLRGRASRDDVMFIASDPTYQGALDALHVKVAEALDEYFATRRPRHYGRPSWGEERGRILVNGRRKQRVGKAHTKRPPPPPANQSEGEDFPRWLNPAAGDVSEDSDDSSDDEDGAAGSGVSLVLPPRAAQPCAYPGATNGAKSTSPAQMRPLTLTSRPHPPPPPPSSPSPEESVIPPPPPPPSSPVPPSSATTRPGSRNPPLLYPPPMPTSAPPTRATATPPRDPELAPCVGKVPAQLILTAGDTEPRRVLAQVAPSQGAIKWEALRIARREVGDVCGGPSYVAIQHVGIAGQDEVYEVGDFGDDLSTLFAAGIPRVFVDVRHP